jgi:hypothetical protein
LILVNNLSNFRWYHTFDFKYFKLFNHIDNQLGYTATAKATRSTRYSGDIGKMINIPIISVNSESIKVF